MPFICRLNNLQPKPQSSPLSDSYTPGYYFSGGPGPGTRQTRSSPSPWGCKVSTLANLTPPHLFILTSTVKVLAYIPLLAWLNLVAPSAMTWLAPSSWDLWALQLSFQWQSDLLTFHTWIIINLCFKTKIQTENKMKCLVTPTRMVVIKRWTIAYSDKGVKNWNPHTLLVGM